ncbi:MAG: hypothetical protein GY739_01730 [Mesoflavibacter sp.]|nr:hypothetical protein [Mesoflavibacter sp.]
MAWNGKEHCCFMQPIDDKKKEKLREQSIKGFVFYDFESRQERPDDDNNEARVHEPNYLVAQTVCDKCEENWKADGWCSNCGDHEIVFEGDDCVENFCNWLFTDHFKGFVAMAHYAKSYDNQFILAYLLKRGTKVDNINRGLEIMRLEVEGTLHTYIAPTYLHNTFFQAFD